MRGLTRNSDVYFRAKCLGIDSSYGFYRFEKTYNRKHKNYVVDMQPESWVKDNVVVVEFDDPENWLGVGKRRVNKKEIDDGESRIAVSKVLCAIVGKKKRIITSCNENHIISAKGHITSFGSELKLQGTEGIRDYLAATKLRRSNSRKVRRNIEIWAGNVPQSLPPKDSTVVCLLSGTDGQLDEKAGRFIQMFSDATNDRTLLPVHPHSQGLTQHMLDAYESLPKGLLFCGFQQLPLGQGT